MNPIARLILVRVGYLALAAVCGIALWLAFLAVFNVSDLVGIRPWQVWSSITTDPGATHARNVLFEYLGQTIRDFGVGYLIGLAIAVVLAVAFSLSVTLENVFMPTAMVLRSIPVIVITPLLTLVFGIGVAGTAAIVTLVVFLPALANILFGLRAAQVQHGDLVRAFGGGGWALLVKVALPGALPALLASARVAIPLSVTGAMIGEWLATGQGLGGYIARSAGDFGFVAMWASAVAVTVFTMLAYTAVSIVDTLVQRRFGALA
jgi:ABC-type nitrate/sulfonate/bicarbonate transport system permease component